MYLLFLSHRLIVCFVYQLTNSTMKHVSVIIGFTPNNWDNINASLFGLEKGFYKCEMKNNCTVLNWNEGKTFGVIQHLPLFVCFITMHTHIHTYLVTNTYTLPFFPYFPGFNLSTLSNTLSSKPFWAKTIWIRESEYCVLTKTSTNVFMLQGWRTFLNGPLL